jgi:hypothetical protein
VAVQRKWVMLWTRKTQALFRCEPVKIDQDDVRFDIVGSGDLLTDGPKHILIFSIVVVPGPELKLNHHFHRDRIGNHWHKSLFIFAL